MDQNFQSQQAPKIQADQILVVSITAKDWNAVLADIQEGIQRRAILLQTMNEQLQAQTGAIMAPADMPHQEPLD